MFFLILYISDSSLRTVWRELQSLGDIFFSVPQWLGPLRETLIDLLIFFCVCIYLYFIHLIYIFFCIGFFSVSKRSSQTCWYIFAYILFCLFYMYFSLYSFFTASHSDSAPQSDRFVYIYLFIYLIYFFLCIGFFTASYSDSGRSERSSESRDLRRETGDHPERDHRGATRWPGGHRLRKLDNIGIKPSIVRVSLLMVLVSFAHQWSSA